MFFGKSCAKMISYWYRPAQDCIFAVLQDWCAWCIACTVLICWEGLMGWWDGMVGGREGVWRGSGRCQPKTEWIQLLRSYIYILSRHPSHLIPSLTSMIAFSWRCISLGNLYIERHSINHFVEQYKTIFPHCWWNLLANTDIQIEANMKSGNQRERQILKSASASANTVVVRCCELFQSCLCCLASVQNNSMGNSSHLNTVEYQTL